MNNESFGPEDLEPRVDAWIRVNFVGNNDQALPLFLALEHARIKNSPEFWVELEREFNQRKAIIEARRQPDDQRRNPRAAKGR